MNVPLMKAWVLSMNQLAAKIAAVHSEFSSSEDDEPLQWTECIPPNSYVKLLTPKMLVLGGGAFEKGLSQKGGSPMNGISALVKETPKN